VRFQKGLKEMMQKEDSKEAAIAMQINDLEGLRAGDKLYLMSVYDKFKKNKDEGKTYRNKSINLDILYGIFAAVVPILIPFSQTYEETVIDVAGFKINVGSVVSIIAVLCSLAGRMIHTLMRASKTKEQAVLYDEESTQTDEELTLFLAKAGYYEGLTSDTDRYKKFVEMYNTIRVNNSRASLFASDASSGSNKANESKTKASDAASGSNKANESKTKASA